MKRFRFIKYCVLIISLCALFTSCIKQKEFLDEAATGITQEIVFNDSAFTSQFLSAIYSVKADVFLPFRLTNFGCLDDLSDNSDNIWTGINNFGPLYNTGSLSPNATAFGSGMWNGYYSKIRAANLLMKNIQQTPISAETRNNWISEARFMRAWYYSNLLRVFGGVVLMGDTVATLEEIPEPKRSSFEETVNYVISELDYCASVLPLTRNFAEYGRPTRGMALANKARILLMAASPLYNAPDAGFGDAQQKLLTAYPSYDVNRWKLAADAAKAVMDLGVYELLEDNTTRPGHGFYRVFITRDQNINKEMIFPHIYTNGTNRNVENAFLPPSKNTNQPGTYPGSIPSLSLAESFNMANGKPITDPTSGYNPQNPNVGREPRFYFTLLYHGATWLNRTGTGATPLDFAYDVNGNAAAADVAGQYKTRSGYYSRKMCDENVTGSTGNNGGAFPLIRYAEVILNYAEALNEFSGPTPDVYANVERIRKRAGLNPFALPTGLTKEQMRAIIRNEHRIEFAYESHRFFDVRRWKIASVTDNQPYEGYFPYRQANGTLLYQKSKYEDRVFRDAFYFFPIAQSEINKAPGILIQNPGY